jgi:hypothetical protein
MKHLFSVLACSIVIFAVNAQSSNKKLIIGKWISEDDSSYKVAFTKTTEFEYNNNELKFTFSYEIRNDSLIATDKSGQM